MSEIERLMKDLKEIKPREYEDLGSGDRHGSEELTWFKTDDEMTRFITVAMTLLGSKHIVEVWIGAEKGVSFTHRLIARYDDVAIALRNETLVTNLRDMVVKAAELATLLTEDDLTEKRIVTLAIKKRIKEGEKVVE